MTVIAEGKIISDSWHARHNNKLMCSVPGCNHVGEIITKVHLREVHGLTREQVKEMYGMPIVQVAKEGFGTAVNMDRWNSTSNSSAFVHRTSFMNLYRKR